MEYAARATPYVDLQGFLQRVFAWMFAGLAVTAVSALAIGSNQQLLTAVISNPVLLIGLFVVELAVVVVLTAAINRLSVPMALSLFFIYAALNGVLFAFVFELYTGNRSSPPS
jgi:uncharacterized protein